MTRPRTQDCKSCGAEMIWATSPADRPMPLDARAVETMEDPRLTGRSLLYRLEGERAVRLGLGEKLPAYLNHFQTCPNAREHTKR